MAHVKKPIFFPFLIVSLFSSAFVHGEYLDDIGDAIFDGIPSVELRLGFEYSSTDDSSSPAKGLSLRSRFGYRTADYIDTNVFVQFHSLINLVEEFSFPGGEGGDRNRDVIADPNGERVHQAYIENQSLPGLRLRLGRQEILLDDQRFIGNVDWRQNGQSFDAITLTYQPISELTLYGSVINQVNTINLDHVDLEHFILVNVRYTLEETHNFAIYTYLLDDEDNENDSFTFGLRTNGLCGDFLIYDLGYARQEDYQGSDVRNADMISTFIGLEFDLLDFGVGYSRISGMDGNDKPFDTLFGTAHKFNGWADQFISTNGGNLRGGLQDVYFQVGTEIMYTRFFLRFHFFDTTEDEEGIHDESYGNEIDFDISRELTDNLTAQIRAAFYNKKETDGNLNPTTDEEVFWARLLYDF